MCPLREERQEGRRLNHEDCKVAGLQRSRSGEATGTIDMKRNDGHAVWSIQFFFYKIDVGLWGPPFTKSISPLRYTHPFDESCLWTLFVLESEGVLRGNHALEVRITFLMNCFLELLLPKLSLKSLFSPLLLL